MKKSVVVSLAFLVLACGNPTPERTPKVQPSDVIARSEVVTPPFDVSGEAEGLLLVWYDPRGDAHVASKRSEIPEAQRGLVRIDALYVAPDQQPDPDRVFVADLRSAGQDGRYSVRKVSREALEVAMASARELPAKGSAQAASDVIIYGASWCGACKQAAQYLTKKGVPFVEKDIEKEPSARSEMLAKAKDQGVNASGIPVIDVRGRLVGGFNPARIEQLLTN